MTCEARTRSSGSCRRLSPQGIGGQNLWPWAAKGAPAGGFFRVRVWEFPAFGAQKGGSGLTVDIDLRSLRGHELAFLIVIMTEARTALVNIAPPQCILLLKMQKNKL